MEPIKAGTPFRNRDTKRSIGNAVYVEEKFGLHKLVTDFGNELIYTDKELYQEMCIPTWYVNGWIEAPDLMEARGGLKERWTLQIELLQTQLNKLLIEEYKDSVLYKQLSKVMDEEELECEFTLLINYKIPINKDKDLFEAFSWGVTPQGRRYWRNILEKLDNL